MTTKKIRCNDCGRKMRFSRVRKNTAVYYCFGCEKEKRLHLNEHLRATGQLPEPFDIYINVYEAEACGIKDGQIMGNAYSPIRFHIIPAIYDLSKEELDSLAKTTLPMVP